MRIRMSWPTPVNCAALLAIARVTSCDPNSLSSTALPSARPCGVNAFVMSRNISHSCPRKPLHQRHEVVRIGRRSFEAGGEGRQQRSHGLRRLFLGEVELLCHRVHGSAVLRFQHHVEQGQHPVGSSLEILVARTIAGNDPRETALFNPAHIDFNIETRRRPAPRCRSSGLCKATAGLRPRSVSWPGSLPESAGRSTRPGHRRWSLRAP